MNSMNYFIFLILKWFSEYQNTNNLIRHLNLKKYSNKNILVFGKQVLLLSFCNIYNCDL